MITRIEIDGFKSFVDFELDVPPFLVLVGANNGGKSNLLEALQFARDAATGSRRVLFDRQRGNAADQFHRDGDGEVARSFFIEVCDRTDDVDPGLRLRVEATLDGVAARTTYRGEENEPLTSERLERWYFLDLDPRVMRRPADASDRGPLAADGSNLAAVLARIAAKGAIGEVLVDAVAVIPHLQDITPVIDPARREVDYELVFSRGGRFRPTVASDGTLRILAILAAAHDPDFPGTLVVDEIETGLHPAYQGQLLRRLRRLVGEHGGSQVIVTTHSPVVLSEILPTDPAGVVYLTQAVRGVAREGRPNAGCAFTHVRTFAPGGERGTFVTPQEVRAYLNTVRPVDLP